MGRDDLDEPWSEAVDIALKVGAITTCDDHEEIYLTNDDDEANVRAYAIASKRYKGDASKVRAMTDAVKQVIGEAASDCPRCENNDNA